MPPEHEIGKEFLNCYDLYSVGVIFYEIINPKNLLIRNLTKLEFKKRNYDSELLEFKKLEYYFPHEVIIIKNLLNLKYKDVLEIMYFF